MCKKLMIDCSDCNTKSIIKVRDSLCEYLKPIIKLYKPIIILCIGSDRSTGDSLGPLVGHKLKFISRENIHVFGTLESPVHAKNLAQTLTYIKKTYTNPYIIAIDACLGSVQNIGKVCIQEKPLCPGSAVNKKLPAVGNLSITGIVNMSGALEFMVLQNTRLFTVMQLADVISKGIHHSILKTFGSKGIKKNSNSSLSINDIYFS